MVKRLTASQENYLETIYNLSQEGVVRIRDIAKTAGVKLPSVTRAINKLADEGLVTHESYGTVEITKQGKEAAQSVIRRDNCLNELLTQVLGMPAEDAEMEVCRMEHVLSHEVLVRLEILVKHAKDTGSKKWLYELHETLNSLNIEKKGIRVGDVNPHVTAR